MDGLIVLGVIALYFMVLIACTIAGYKIAAERGLSKVKRWVGAAIGFGVIFVPVFWDTIPTLWLHRHYCQTEGGFTVYKTLEQWKAENPGVAQTLVAVPVPHNRRLVAGEVQAYQLNQRFRLEVGEELRSFGIRKRREALVDVRKGDALAEYINFSTAISDWSSGIHSFRDVKVWMNRNFCTDDPRTSGRLPFGEFWSQSMLLGDDK